MKTLKQIRIQLKDHVIINGGDPEDDGVTARLYSGGAPLSIIASWGLDWDHVSVSLPGRVPSWAEMCFVKDFFFHPNECVIQYHPPEEKYVNDHPNVLHLWRPQQVRIPMPPLAFV